MVFWRKCLFSGSRMILSVQPERQCNAVIKWPCQSPGLSPINILQQDLKINIPRHTLFNLNKMKVFWKTFGLQKLLERVKSPAVSVSINMAWKILQSNPRFFLTEWKLGNETSEVIKRRDYHTSIYKKLWRPTFQITELWKPAREVMVCFSLHSWEDYQHVCT